MSNPNISIIMPVKNTGIFLSECLESIVNQTTTDWELMVIDDHSTDNSHDILRTYARQDARIKVFRNSGSGIIAALQTGYHHAKGTYITRMDSDDRMTTHKLELLRNQLQSKGEGHLAVGWVSYFSQEELGEGYQRYEKWLNDLTRTASNFSDIYRECSIPSPCWMVHRSDFEVCGGFESEVYPEDYDLAFRFKKQGLKIAPVRQVIHQWRDYPNRTSRTDSNYADNRFLELKVHHFLDQDYDSNLALLLWGAGRKGKKIAQLLILQNRPFRWFCNNPKKIGKDIYGIVLEDVDVLIEEEEKAQVIVGVSTFYEGAETNVVILKGKQHGYFRFA